MFDVIVVSHPFLQIMFHSAQVSRVLLFLLLVTSLCVEPRGINPSLLLLPHIIGIEAVYLHSKKLGSMWG